MLKLLSDADPKLVNIKRMPVVISHFPSGTSIKNF